MADKNQLAFPTGSILSGGMTLRQYYAGQALTGLLTKIDLEYGQAAEYAVKHADAIIAELDK